MADEPWYGAKCVFLHDDIESCPGRVYEERVVLLRAGGFDEAVARAEALAEEYAREVGGCAYVGFVDVFHIYGESVGEGSEVYSLMRTSDLGEEEYLDRFYDTGAERTRKGRG